MIILGVSAYFHDSAAVLLRDGAIVAAAQEERFTRRKHDPEWPRRAIEWCLRRARLSLRDVDRVVFYDRPLRKLARLGETWLAMAPRGAGAFETAVNALARGRYNQRARILDELAAAAPGVRWRDRLLFSEHHLSHAASAFFPSPFDEALVLTVDGVGEWATTSVFIGRGDQLELVKEQHFPHSLGLLYSAVTDYLGFKVNSGEYKIMGLAPYGSPRFRDRLLHEMVQLRDDGSFFLRPEWFDFLSGLRMAGPAMEHFFGQPFREPEAPLEPIHMDIAASIQAVTEEVMMRMVRALTAEHRMENLCMAGGVALNCVANGRILREGLVRRLWVQPAAGDAGGALGAALAAWHIAAQQPRPPADGRDRMQGAYLGPDYGPRDIEDRLLRAGARFTLVDDRTVLEATAAALAEGAAVGWFQGRMEFGPRALGARSILGDPRSPTMQKLLNLKIKYRESFRPFAPAVLAEEVSEWFSFEGESPYMLLVAPVAQQRMRALPEQAASLRGLELLYLDRSEIPAVTHVDGSARLQTVHHETNPRFHSLISRFRELTGCPVLINTSFNIRGEPIVCSPEDAFRCFMGTELDLLVVGNCILRKTEQDPALRADYRAAFELD